ncbi:MAG TPA: excinuclease ABC subunit UvrC [Bacteroidota bacterium]|nr:excinuclease ABC subunit UvrC [Bacteroidota bacterium]
MGQEFQSGSSLSLQEKLESLPQKPGVYQFKNAEGKVLYVGKAQNLRSRVRQYFQKSRSTDSRLDALVPKIRDLDLIVTDSEVEALILEANLIKKLKPRYNVLLKDDKSYPYIVITDEPFPRVFVTRRIFKDGSKYFGPYADVKTMRHALKTVRDIFMIRSCNYDLTDETVSKKKYKVCLDYHIKKCGGPCEGLVTREHYRSMIDQVAKILRGKTEEVMRSLRSEMEKSSEGLRFEDAARIRDRLKAIEVYNERQKVVDAKAEDRDIIAIAARGDDAAAVIFKVREGKVLGSRHFYLNNAEDKKEEELLEALMERYYLESDDIPPQILLPAVVESESLIRSWLAARAGFEVSMDVPKAGDKAKLIAMVRNNAQYLLDDLEVQRLKRGETFPHAVGALQKDLRIESPPRRIECFDISNTQGTDSVASLVVFVDGKPKKSEYRKFKIKTVEGADDFASMQEVVQRRYTRILEEGTPMPDLIMVDGGKGQLSSAREILRKLGLERQPIIGLAKRLEEVYVPAQSDPLSIPKTSAGLKLLQQIRNEAHRFAITFHRTLRSQRILHTELDLVKGVGKARAKELLEAFGSVQGVKFASEEQLAEIVGAVVAGRIKEYFVDDPGSQ